jgi:ligand-binding SRPBCC domain-containing protein
MYYELTDHFIVAASLERTWEFFSSAENLPAITPPSLGFKIMTPAPITIANDALLDYTIRWAGLPIRWRTRIIDWTPPRQFIDLQIRGPYALWHHQHTFTEVAGGVECTDRVIYKLPGSIVGRAVHALLVKRQLLAIFRYRREVIGRELGWVRAVQPDVRIRALG